MIKTSENKLAPFPTVALRINREYWIIGSRGCPNIVTTIEGWEMPASWDVEFLKWDGRRKWSKV